MGQDEAVYSLPYDDWASWQLPFATYVMKISSIASISGSSYIIFQVLARGKNRREHLLGKCYHRIMLCLSFFNVIGSFGIFIGSWMVPADVIYNFVFENFGTVATCEIAGFMVQIGIL